jgi:hypothetical protein
MEELSPIFIRILKYVLASGLLVLLYFWLFRGKASHQSCRYFLLTIPFLSLGMTLFTFEVPVKIPDYLYSTSLIPFESRSENKDLAAHRELGYTVKITNIKYYNDASTLLNEQQELAEKDKGLSMLQWFYMIVAAITLFLLGHFLFQLNRILRYKRHGTRLVQDTYSMVVHPEVSTPFTFMKTMYLNDAMSDSKRSMVVKHEAYHIQHKHYIDVLLSQLFVRLGWFNPIHWWIQKELSCIHEFQTDQSVIDEGFDVYRYQTIILEEVMSNNPFLASGLNDSFTKRRFVMMQSTPKIRWESLRRFALVPILALVFCGFSLDVKAISEYYLMGSAAYYAYEMNGLDAQWDESSQLCNFSNTYKTAFNSDRYQTDCSQYYFSYLLNSDTLVKLETINQQLSKLGNQLIQISKELEAYSTNKQSKKATKSIADLINYLNIHQNSTYLPTVKCDPSVLDSMKAEDLQDGIKLFHVLGRLALKAQKSDLVSDDKLLDFKYLVNELMKDNLFWSFLEPPLVQMAVSGQTTNSNIVFLRLGRKRLRHLEHDARIWNNAPRFDASKVLVSDNPASHWNRNSGIQKIERTADATKITMTYHVGGNEWWFYFGKGLSLVDCQTKEIYQIKYVENKFPLDKTFIITGCCNKYVSFVLVFPHLPASVKTIQLRDFISEDADVMSDNGGDSEVEDLVLSDYGC